MNVVKYIINDLKNTGWEEFTIAILALTGAYLWIIGAVLRWW